LVPSNEDLGNDYIVFPLRFTGVAASAAAANSEPFMISFAKSAVAPDSYSFKCALPSGDPAGEVIRIRLSRHQADGYLEGEDSLAKPFQFALRYSH